MLATIRVVLDVQRDTTPGGGYTRQRVLWLLGISRGDAIRHDAEPRSQFAQSDGGSNAEEPLFVIAEWTDVHRAKEAITRSNIERLILELRARAYTEEEIAVMTGVGRSTVRRRFAATLDQLLDVLGVVEEVRFDVGAPSCISCGKGRRVRLAEVMVERWTCMGRRRRPDGNLAQAWLTPGQTVRLFRPPLGWSFKPGQAAEVVVTQGHKLSHERREAYDLPDDDMHVRAWRADERDALEGREPVARGANLGRVATPTRLVDPEKLSGVCERCLAPAFRPRVVMARREPAAGPPVARALREQSGAVGRE